MRLVRVAGHEIAELRLAKLRSLRTPLLPRFHVEAAARADSFQVVDGKAVVGYVLLLEEAHSGHVHRVILEAYLSPAYDDRYEDLLRTVTSGLQPQAYLVRSDECLWVTALLSSGLQVEMTKALMLARAVPCSVSMPELALTPLDYPHLQAAHAVLVHAQGEERAPRLEAMPALVTAGTCWVLTVAGEVVGVVFREKALGGPYVVIDLFAPYRTEDEQLWAICEAMRQAEREGLVPSALIDFADSHKLDLFRQAGFYSVAAYMVFYDPAAGRPSVGVISREEMVELIQKGAPIRLLDVLGEEHWKDGHLPGAEWIDFRALSREARKRFQKDEAIVVYCNGFG